MDTKKCAETLAQLEKRISLEKKNESKNEEELGELVQELADLVPRAMELKYVGGNIFYAKIVYKRAVVFEYRERCLFQITVTPEQLVEIILEIYETKLNSIAAGNEELLRAKYQLEQVIGILTK